jgi:1-acyl-sn-glycerol-3-phosphate acyltransferase
MFTELFFICNASFVSMLTYILSFDHNMFYIMVTRIMGYIARICGLRVFIYGDKFDSYEDALIISNHKTMFDIVSIFYIVGHFNNTIGFCLKKQINIIPGIGWWCKRMKFPALERNENDLKLLSQVTRDYQIVIYPEGTRYTNKNYRNSLDYALKSGFPISKYACVPRHRGSFALSKNIIYQMTFVYLDKHQRIITSEVTEFPSRIYIHVKRHTNIPKTEPEYKLWLQNQFKKIDDIYDIFEPNNAIEMVPNFKRNDYIVIGLYVMIHIGIGYFIINRLFGQTVNEL